MGDLLEIRDKAIQIASTACKLDNQKKYEDAFKKYVEAIELFHHVIKCMLKLIFR